jgi:hypothetical protein
MDVTQRRCEHTEGHERLALHAAQNLLETAFIVEFPGGYRGPISFRSQMVPNEIWDMAHSFSSKDEGSGRPDTGLVMINAVQRRQSVLGPVAFKYGQNRLSQRQRAIPTRVLMRAVVVGCCVCNMLVSESRVHRKS